MSRPIILAWVLSVCTALRKSQAKTLAELVAAALPTERATLAKLGRAMAGPARCKHRIKRAGRFVANRRVSVADGMAGVIARLTRGRRACPVIVSLDWVEVRFPKFRGHEVNGVDSERGVHRWHDREPRTPPSSSIRR